MPAISQKRVNDLIGDIYESAKDPSFDGWKATYAKISQTLSSGPGSLSFVDKRTHFFSPIAYTNEPGFFDDLNSTYYPILPYRKNLERLRTGETLDRLRDCPDEKYVPTDLYQKHFKRLGIYQVLYQRLYDDDEISIGVSFTRPFGMPDFDKYELAALAMLSPHLQRAIYLHIKLSHFARDKQILTDAWNEIANGVFIISKAGGILLRNDAANRLLAGRNGIEIDRSGTLACSVPKDTQRLRHLVQSVFEPGCGGPARSGGRMLVSRPNGSLPLSLLISPFSEKSIGRSESETLALVLISDPDIKSLSFEKDLSMMYGLTPAEAHLASFLADGFSIKETCRQLDISANTARTHLKHVFSKTNTNRQSALVKLILSGPIGRGK